MDINNQKQPIIKKKVGCLKIFLIIIGGSILIGIIGSMLSGSDSSQQIQQKSDVSNMAYVISKGFVKQALKAPSTADFPFLDFNSQSLDDDRYQVSSYVDSQNSFGAVIRNEWTTTLKYLGGADADPRNWELEKMIIGDEIVYEK